MNKVFLVEQLQIMQNAKRENRLRVANIVVKNTELMPFLIDQVFNVENKLSIKAAWSLELVCEQKLELLVPYLDIFTDNIQHLKFESAIRPAAKICNFLAIVYTSRKTNPIKDSLTKLHIETIIETGFDWMINNHKVAAKAYSMNMLYLFGKNYDWVHSELKLILQQNISNESAAYKARGKMTLDLINKR